MPNPVTDLTFYGTSWRVVDVEETTAGPRYTFKDPSGRRAFTIRMVAGAGSMRVALERNDQLRPRPIQGLKLRDNGPEGLRVTQDVTPTDEERHPDPAEGVDTSRGTR